ncbi:MAG: HEAT repeat domain-containing protein, partial [Pirellulales bacterium]
MDIDPLGLFLLHFSLNCMKIVRFDLVGYGRYRDNHMHRGFLWSRFSFVIIALLCATGCQQLSPFNWNVINPTTAYPEWHDDDKYMTTWHDKHRDLSDLRENAAGMSHNKQVLHATALSSQIKQEQVPVVRREMVRALMALPVVEAEPGLEVALTDEDADIRVIACQAWGKRQTDRAFKLLLETWRSDT